VWKDLIAPLLENEAAFVARAAGFAGVVDVGDILRVRLRVTLEKAQSCVLVEDRRPAGLEFADERLQGPAAAGAAHAEFRDDRVAVFFTDLDAGTHELFYDLRAETRGTSHMLPCVVYPMYREHVRGETAATVVRVE
jgi:uncharacterized protein YfaS (alpha-2-macroglobulin family)